MTPKTDTETTTSDNQNSNQTPTAAPPSGLTYAIRGDREKKFQACWRELNGKRRSAAFMTAEERDKFAAGWSKQRAKLGTYVPVVVAKDAARWNLFAELTGNADPIEVAQFWLANKGEAEGGTMTVSQAVEQFIADRRRDGRTGGGNAHVELHVERFAASYGKKMLRDVTTTDVRDWLGSLVGESGSPPAAPWTLRDHLKNLKVLFSTARTEGWIATNSIAAISRPEIIKEDVTILTVDDAERFFDANRGSLVIGRLALEAFGGLRFSSAQRLNAATDLKIKEKGIEFPAKKHKSGRRHYVDGYPENLWKWVKHAPQACWEVNARQYMELKSAAFARAKVTNPGNVLRHSFCSYHVAMHKNADRTAVLLTHTSAEELWADYKGRASEADGKKYFSIVP